jgi:hypothetical protein
MVEVFDEGLKINEDDFEIDQDTIDNSTTITFNQGREENDNIIIIAPSTRKARYDFIAVSGQTELTVDDDVFNDAQIYINGVLIARNKYEISNDGTDTKVTFDNGLVDNDWVHILY